MIFKLTEQNIVDNWPLIKYGALQASGIPDKDAQQYITGLLKNLLMDKEQCWFIISENKVKTLILTRVIVDSGNTPHLLVDSAYGYMPTTDEEKIQGMDEVMKLADNLRCKSIIAYTDNPMAANAMKKMGMKHKFNAYSKEIGG